MPQHYRLGLIGFGNVGQALARLLLKKSTELRDRYDLTWSLNGVASRRLGWRLAADGFDVDQILTLGPAATPAETASDVTEWLRLARLDALFEVSSLEPLTGQPAIDHLEAALRHGTHVITANKGPMVHRAVELAALARQAGRQFRYEASVMGGAPIFSLFRESLPALRLLSFRGLLNATTSVILDALARGDDFDAAVRQAQALGVAETDPSHDVDGWDPAVKLVALATALFERPLGLAEVKRVSVRDLDPALVRQAHADNRPYRVVARADLVNDQLVASVRPEPLASGDPLRIATGTTLVAHFVTDVLPGLTIVLQAGDAATTAYDLLADFINIARRPI